MITKVIQILFPPRTINSKFNYEANKTLAISCKDGCKHAPWPHILVHVNITFFSEPIHFCCKASPYWTPVYYNLSPFGVPSHALDHSSQNSPHSVWGEHEKEVWFLVMAVQSLLLENAPPVCWYHSLSPDCWHVHTTLSPWGHAASRLHAQETRERSLLPPSPVCTFSFTSPQTRDSFFSPVVSLSNFLKPLSFPFFPKEGVII